VRIEDGKKEAKENISLSAYVNFNDESTWKKALEEYLSEEEKENLDSIVMRLIGYR
jgi:hypothetical protein